MIALYENNIPFGLRCLGADAPQHPAVWLKHWPLGTFPLLLDGECSVVETSVIIGYLQRTRPGPLRLLPADALQGLDVRFFDRFFNLH